VSFLPSNHPSVISFLPSIYHLLSFFPSHLPSFLPYWKRSNSGGGGTPALTDSKEGWQGWRKEGRGKNKDGSKDGSKDGDLNFGIYAIPLTSSRTFFGAFISSYTGTSSIDTTCTIWDIETRQVFGTPPRLHVSPFLRSSEVDISCSRVSSAEYGKDKNSLRPRPPKRGGSCSCSSPV
jgi:hypothetical protein